MNIVLQLILGLFIGDFLTALYHWIEDLYIPYHINTKLPDVALYNELHHFYPRAMLAGDPLDNIKDSLILSIVLLLIILVFFPETFQNYKWIIVPCLLVVAFANYIHRLSHYRACEQSALHAFLTDSKILINSTTHSKHHVSSNCNYGVVFEPFNYVYEKTGIFNCLENIGDCLKIPKCKKPGIDFYKQFYSDKLLYLTSQECPAKLSMEEKTELTCLIKDLACKNILPVCAN